MHPSVIAGLIILGAITAGLVGGAASEVFLGEPLYSVLLRLFQIRRD